jgi:hypothetical protein
MRNKGVYSNENKPHPLFWGFSEFIGNMKGGLFNLIMFADSIALTVIAFLGAGGPFFFYFPSWVWLVAGPATASWFGYKFLRPWLNESVVR